MYWIYSALTRSGQEVKSSLAGSKNDILKQLSHLNLSVIDVHLDYRRTFLRFLQKRKLSALTLAVFFEDFSNMLETGMSVSQILLTFKETSQEEALNDVLLVLENKLAQGQSL